MELKRNDTCGEQLRFFIKSAGFVLLSVKQNELWVPEEEAMLFKKN
jgi:hypothetical protein